MNERHRTLSPLSAVAAFLAVPRLILKSQVLMFRLLSRCRRWGAVREGNELLMIGIGQFHAPRLPVGCSLRQPVLG